MQAVQQALFATQVGVPGQFLNPATQAMPQLVPSQVALPFEGGLGQAEHRVPQVATLVSDEQVPLQSCVPIGQVPPQGCPVLIQAPEQIRWSVGQVVPQATPLQVAVPPVGTGQAIHDEAPQFSVSRLSTQRLPHK